MRGEKHNFRKNGSEIFVMEGVDGAKRIEMARENRGFGAVAFLLFGRACGG
jgi:hypothetical protein